MGAGLRGPFGSRPGVQGISGFLAETFMISRLQYGLRFTAFRVQSLGPRALQGLAGLAFRVRDVGFVQHVGFRVWSCVLCWRLKAWD